EVLFQEGDACWVWDGQTGKERVAIPAGMKTLAITPEAGLAAVLGKLSGETEESLQLWDLAAGKQLQVVAKQLPPIPIKRPVGEIVEGKGRVEISPNGRFLLIDDSSEELSIRVWDI